jgi:hypothetical protein
MASASPEALLCAAAAAGNAEEVARLLDSGLSANCKDEVSAHALGKRPGAARAHCAPPDALANRSQRRTPPLVLAAATDNAYEALRLLLRRGADPNIEAEDTRVYPLSMACWRCCNRSIRALLRAGADPLRRDACGRRCVRAARQHTLT